MDVSFLWGYLKYTYIQYICLFSKTLCVVFFIQFTFLLFTHLISVLLLVILDSLLGFKKGELLKSWLAAMCAWIGDSSSGLAIHWRITWLVSLGLSFQISQPLQRKAFQLLAWRRAACLPALRELSRKSAEGPTPCMHGGQGNGPLRMPVS